MPIQNKDAPTKLDAIKALTVRAVAESLGRKLIAEHDPGEVLQYCRYYDYQKKRKPGLGPGWLVKAIEDKYDLPKEFRLQESMNDRHRYLRGEYAEYIEH